MPSSAAGISREPNYLPTYLNEAPAARQTDPLARLRTTHYLPESGATSKHNACDGWHRPTIPSTDFWVESIKSDQSGRVLCRWLHSYKRVPNQQWHAHQPQPAFATATDTSSLSRRVRVYADRPSVRTPEPAKLRHLPKEKSPLRQAHAMLQLPSSPDSVHISSARPGTAPTTSKRSECATETGLERAGD